MAVGPECVIELSGDGRFIPRSWFKKITTCPSGVAHVWVPLVEHCHIGEELKHLIRRLVNFEMSRELDHNENSTEHHQRPDELAESEPSCHRIRRVDWVEEIGGRVGHLTAANECFAELGTVDESMLAEVDALRSQGVIVAVLTNGTDTIPAEMEALGLDSRSM